MMRLPAEQRVMISKALADPGRYAMLQQIAAEDQLSCAALHAHASLSPATISHHLKELQVAGLVIAEREGRGMKLMLNREVWAAYLRELAAL